jgi:hypothetical protein
MVVAGALQHALKRYSRHPQKLSDLDYGNITARRSRVGGIATKTEPCPGLRYGHHVSLTWCGHSVVAPSFDALMRMRLTLILEALTMTIVKTNWSAGQ